MTTNYDLIAEQYQRSKQQPWRIFVECFTLMELIGDPSGLEVLDVACGEGFYSRLIRQRGAARVTAVDRSRGMIELARRQASQHQLGIEYILADARNLKLEDEFDLAFAAYLLNYARTRAELERMCLGIVERLKPGGRFVGVISNPSLDFTSIPSYRKYGFEPSPPGELREGTAIKWTFHVDEGPFEIENYYLDKASHDEAFRRAGFRAIHWHKPRLSPEGLAGRPRDYWAEFLADPPVIFIECVR